MLSDATPCAIILYMPHLLLREYRERKGMSQIRLSVVSRVERRTIQYIENGTTKNPSRLTMVKLCTALETSPIDIFFPEFTCQKNPQNQ